MTAIRVVHTADLTPRERVALRTLLDEAFDGEFGDDDWDHLLGGLHVVVDGEAHASVVQRQLLHDGRPLRAAYVEGVVVRAASRGRGLGRLVMAEVHRIVDAAYDLGALSSTDDGLGFYPALGWLPWRGSSGVLTPDGVAPTPDEDLLVRPVAGVPLDLDGDLVCEPRGGDPW